uniref:Hypothetical reverse transcriptase n=1 Tax=Pediastrum duplex TaxID=3105 RepID=A0A344PFN6_PEDDU|nr:hypothetical reverse transcriptase [Pediastrum duplex]
MALQRYKGLNIKRKDLESQYSETLFKSLRTIGAIATKSASNPDATFDNLTRIISNEGILYQAIGNISGKGGTLTPGPSLDPTTVDSTSKELVERLAKELKEGTFRFKPIRRVYMDKSGKNPVTDEQMKKRKELHFKGKVTMDQIKELKARPLGISSFPDKVVQEAMRMTLEAIYEPNFARTNVNFGFRNKYGCSDAIIQIKEKTKSMNYAIEGDIKGAFDNVNHKTLMNILRKKVKDEKFLKLILGGLKCGVMFLNYRQDSELGTVQGSVLSPLLYNIYFHEFDIYIETTFKEQIKQINEKENRKDKPINKLYTSIQKKKTKIGLKAKLEAVKEYKSQGNVNMDTLKGLQKVLGMALKDYKELDRQQKKLTPIATSRKKIRYTYHRYADDWVIFTNANKERLMEWKQQFAQWIKTELELTLSPEKTKITDLNLGHYVKFLGYQMHKRRKRKSISLRTVGTYKIYQLDPIRRVKRKKVKIKDTGIIQYMSRTVNPTLIVSWDRDRVLTRMATNGFIRKIGKAYRGKSKLPWTVLKAPEIVERFNYIIRGYINYYSPVNEQTTDIQYLHYLLTYSCAHTLAQKFRTSIRKIFRKFGKDIKIKYIEKVEKLNRDGTKENTEVNKEVRLINWQKTLDIMNEAVSNMKKKRKEGTSISLVAKSVDDICNVKVNWRTAYKISKHCAICGYTEGIEYHHVKHIRIGKVSGFLQIMKTLNRKQIPCCEACHKKIHKGLYDRISLKDLYDEELIII